LKFAYQCEKIFQYSKRIGFEALSHASTMKPKEVKISEVTSDVSITVGSFKMKVQEKLHVMVDRLIYGTTVLKEDLSLGTYGLVPSSHLLICPATESNLY